MSVTHQQQRALVQLLLTLSGIQNFATRTSLLTGIPNALSLQRDETSAFTDIDQIVMQVSMIDLSGSGEPALWLLLENALARVSSGSKQGQEFLLFKEQIQGPTTGQKSLQQKKFDILTELQQLDNKTISLCYCYAAADAQICHDLDKHFAMPKRHSELRVWHAVEGDIPDNCEPVFSYTDIVILLVSSDFMASAALHDQIVLPAMKLSDQDKICVIPAIARPARWEKSVFHGLQSVPRNTQPIVTWGNYDEACYVVAQEIYTVIERVKSEKSRRML